MASSKHTGLVSQRAGHAALIEMGLPPEYALAQ